ncbi:MAG: hypothetical protein IT379_03165 [Deltaproteobacteria bacterium]|nr:hypothetical protein [Deltaproteobacteria bacterium]
MQSRLLALRERARAIPRWRFLVLLLVPLALVVGREVHGAMSHDIPVMIRWADDEAIERVSVEYARDGEVVQTAVFHPGRGARSVRHEAHLGTGRYDVSVELQGVDETRAYRRRVDAPSEGTVILRVGGDR